MISFLPKPKSKDNKTKIEDKVKSQEQIQKDKENQLREKKQLEEDKKAINDLQFHWKYLMGQTEKFNKFKKSFGLNNIRCTDYGFLVDIYAPTAMYLEELENLKPYIETEFSCEFVYKIKYNTNKQKYAEARFINPEKVKCNSIPFTPYTVKPYEFFAGIDISGEPIIFNVNIAPQILIAGQQRRGKNCSLDHAMISWIHHCSEEEIQFYLFQCAKNDLIKYKDCKHVRCYIEGNLEEIVIVLEHILKEMNRRKELFEDMMSKADGNDNIFHYNNLHKYNQLPYIYIVIDEFIELMPDNDLDNKEIKFLKNTILRYLQSIAQWGGSYGCNYIICHQKPSVKLCPSFLKNMSSTRICFGFEDETCCQIVLGSGLMKMAHKLPPRKAFYTDNETNGYLYTTDLKGRIRKYIEKSIKTGHRTIFDDLEKLGVYKKDNNSANNSNQTTSDNSGKEDVSYEVMLKQKEEELKKQAEEQLKREKEIESKLKLLEAKEKSNQQQREVYKDTFDKVIPDKQKLIEEARNKNPNWVEWIPPPQTGKEKVK